MDRFVSIFENKLDSKGRVSVPASFRSVLARDGFEGVFCYPTLDAESLDAGGQDLVGQIHRLLDNLPLYSEERDHLSTALFGVSEILKIDSDGRIVLPERMRSYAGILDRVTFVGLGNKFQIWEPGRFEIHLHSSRERLREMKRRLTAPGAEGSSV